MGQDLEHHAFLNRLNGSKNFKIHGYGKTSVERRQGTGPEARVCLCYRKSRLTRLMQAKEGGVRWC